MVLIYDTVTRSEVKGQTQLHNSIFFADSKFSYRTHLQGGYSMCHCLHPVAIILNIHFSLPPTFHLKDLQSVVEQQRADMDLARDALSALCRAHPSQELSCFSSELTSIAKRTEAVAQRCAKTRGNLQDELQLHFNSKRYEFILIYCVQLCQRWLCFSLFQTNTLSDFSTSNSRQVAVIASPF